MTDNPPAFPNAHGISICETTGMTLRDYFAGQALYAARSTMDTRNIEYKLQAREAYSFADAMLAERIKS